MTRPRKEQEKETLNAKRTDTLVLRAQEEGSEDHGEVGGVHVVAVGVVGQAGQVEKEHLGHSPVGCGQSLQQTGYRAPSLCPGGRIGEGGGVDEGRVQLPGQQRLGQGSQVLLHRPACSVHACLARARHQHFAHLYTATTARREEETMSKRTRRRGKAIERTASVAGFLDKGDFAWVCWDAK